MVDDRVLKFKGLKVSKSFSQKHYEDFQDTIKYFSYDKWLKFLELVKTKEDKNRKRNILIFSLLLSSGTRIKEFGLIKVSDIDFNNCYITIPAENTKTKKKRVVRVNKILMLDLKEYLNDRNIKSGYVFRNKNNLPFTNRFYHKLFIKYFEDQDIKNNLNLDFTPHPHTLRHCHIIYSLQQGVSINAIQQNVGHLDLKTTMIYSKLAGVEIIKEYEKTEF